jgi:hypothetical protein
MQVHWFILILQSKTLIKIFKCAIEFIINILIIKDKNDL